MFGDGFRVNLLLSTRRPVVAFDPVQLLAEWFFYFAEELENPASARESRRVQKNLSLKIDIYQIVMRFPRLFPDPAIFEDTFHLARRYLLQNGLSREKSEFIYQTTDDILPEDDRGNPSTPSGTGKFLFDGRTILAEFMSNANVRLDYADFGTGLVSSDHSRMWTKGKLGELRFELRTFKHESTTINVPAISELYKILSESATTSALSTVEIESVSPRGFAAVLAYTRDRLVSAANADGLDVEVYAAKDLSASERSALERRLGRESSGNTIFVILSRRNPSMLQPALE